MPTVILIVLNCNMQLWLVTSGEVQKKTPTASYHNSLAYHGSAVNALRFSPYGKHAPPCSINVFIVLKENETRNYLRNLRRT